MLRVLMMVLLFAVPANAGVHYNEETKTATLYGTTTSAQWVWLNNLVASKEIRMLNLQGPGGDFYAGLAIGRLIRKHDFTVTIPKDTQCASACAWAALASRKIYVDGQMLIHRGFYMQMPTMSTLDEFARRSGAGMHDGTKYLIEMGYTFNFAKSVVVDSTPCIFLDLGSTAFVEQLRDPDPFSIKPNLAMGKVKTCNG